MTEIAHCEFGLISRLQCGDKSLYVLERPYNFTEPTLGAIMGGNYRVINYHDTDGTQHWYLLASSAYQTPEFLSTRHVVFNKSDFVLGIALGCEDGKWCVVNRRIAGTIFKEWLTDITSFNLYIKRHSAPMKNDTKD